MISFFSHFFIKLTRFSCLQHAPIVLATNKQKDIFFFIKFTTSQVRKIEEPWSMSKQRHLNCIFSSFCLLTARAHFFSFFFIDSQLIWSSFFTCSARVALRSRWGWVGPAGLVPRTASAQPPDTWGTRPAGAASALPWAAPARTWRPRSAGTVPVGWRSPGPRSRSRGGLRPRPGSRRWSGRPSASWGCWWHLWERKRKNVAYNKLKLN